MKTLLPYQQAGAATMAAHRRLYNADQPGLGKTLQALEALKQLGGPPVAVLCPAIARTGWQREAAEHGVTLHYLESYDRYVRNAEARTQLQQLAPSVMILDEAHVLGNLESRRTFELLGRSGPVRRADVVWPLSGTPLRRGPATVFGLLACAWPERLRARRIHSYRGYLDRYCYWYEDAKFGLRVRPGTRNAEEFKALWQSIALRRLTKDVLPELPAMTWQNLVLDATPSPELLAREATYGERFEVMQGLAAQDMTNTAMATLRQLIGVAKAPASVQVIAEELEGGQDKVFVLAYHRAVLDILAEGLATYGVARIDGSTPDAERTARQVRFQTDPACRVFLGQIQAVQMAVTLTAANVAHMVEPLWVDDDNMQAAKRIHRIGQERPVVVRVHTLAGSLDETINQYLLAQQRAMQLATGEAPASHTMARTVHVG